MSESQCPERHNPERDLAARLDRALLDLASAQSEIEALKHDIARHSQIAAEEATRAERNAKNSERYCFLRDFLDPNDYYSKFPRWTVARESGGMGSIFRGEQLDREVDAALASGEKGDGT